MIILLIIVILFTIAHLMAKYKPFLNSPYEFAYYHINYWGVCFLPINEQFIILGGQTGKNGCDKCITICNISLMFGISN